MVARNDLIIVKRFFEWISSVFYFTNAYFTVLAMPKPYKYVCRLLNVFCKLFIFDFIIIIIIIIIDNPRLIELFVVVVESSSN